MVSLSRCEDVYLVPPRMARDRYHDQEYHAVLLPESTPDSLCSSYYVIMPDYITAIVITMTDGLT